MESSRGYFTDSTELSAVLEYEVAIAEFHNHQQHHSREQGVVFMKSVYWCKVMEKSNQRHQLSVLTMANQYDSMRNKLYFSSIAAAAP